MTVTRIDFQELFAKHFFLTQNKAAFLTEAIIEEIYQCLFEEPVLKISSFGTFMVHEKNARVGRNPKTGQEAVITARKSLSFRPSQILKDRINRRKGVILEGAK